jgi:hypothetical protein
LIRLKEALVEDTSVRPLSPARGERFGSFTVPSRSSHPFSGDYTLEIETIPEGVARLFDRNVIFCENHIVFLPYFYGRGGIYLVKFP